MHTLTKSLSYVTSTLHMTKSKGITTASGNIAAVISGTHTFDIHHIILSGYFSANGGTSFGDCHSGGIAGDLLGKNGTNIEIFIHNIMVLGNQIIIDHLVSVAMLVG